MALSAPFLWGKVFEIFETMKFENAEKAASRKFTKPPAQRQGAENQGESDLRLT